MRLEEARNQNGRKMTPPCRSLGRFSPRPRGGCPPITFAFHVLTWPHAGDRVQAPFDDVLEVNSQSAYVHSRVITIDAEYMISYAPRRFKKAATAKT